MANPPFISTFTTIKRFPPSDTASSSSSQPAPKNPNVSSTKGRLYLNSHITRPSDSNNNLHPHASSEGKADEDGSVPSFRVHSKPNLYRNCVISNSHVGREATSAKTASGPTQAQTTQVTYHYQPPSNNTVLASNTRRTIIMPQATNMSNDPPSNNDNDPFSNSHQQQHRPFPSSSSLRLSMPFRTAFARHGNLRSDLFRDDFFDDVFQLDSDRRLSFDDDDSHDLFSAVTSRGSSHSQRDNSPMMERQSQVISHPIRRLSSSDEDAYNWNGRAPRSGLEDNLIEHIIHTEAPDQLQQRVKIFIAQDRARGLGNRDSFPRFSAQLPHGGSLHFSFSTSSNSSTLHINDAQESGQVPPHAMLTIEQKKQLKQRLLAQKQELISGPNTSATILKSEEIQSLDGSSPKAQSNPGSVAERVMWFEGVPRLEISHHPPGRLQRSAAHIALQNWRNGLSEHPGEDAPYPSQRPPSVERTIPIIRETDSPPPPPLKPTNNSNAISITLEVPSKQNARTIAGLDALTPSKPGNHIANVAPQTAVISDHPIKTTTKPFDNKPVERIIPTILPSPEPKLIDRKLYPDPIKEHDSSRETRSVKSPEILKASETIIKALQNGMKREEAKEEPKIIPSSKSKTASPPKGIVHSQNINIPKEHVPPFHYPRGKPMKAESEYVIMERVRKAFGTRTELKLDEMKDLMEALNLPLFWRKPILLAAVANGPPRETVTFDLLWNAWKRITVNCHDDAARFVCLLAQPGCHYLLPNDFIPLIQDVVDTHPGLNILKEAPEFHARYTNTVIARIFYCVNRSWSGRITIEELRRSNFLRVLAMLEHEDDINVITEYFSYEHFYVIYCKFWELDRDHDLLIDRADLARHNDHAISSKMIDRIFSGAVTRGPSQKEGKMSYTEFVWFLIAEEDKRHPTSIEYWFRCMDIDGDGVLSLFELEYFYAEQLQRMKSLGIEALPFEDIACQMLDMVHPKHKNRILLKDLKRCRMTPLFFDTFFNIEKYLLHEHRDPFASAKVDAEDNEPISDWERYASEEYEILVSEDAASEDL